MIDLKKIRVDRLKWYEWKDIKILRSGLDKLPSPKDIIFQNSNTIKISSETLKNDDIQEIKDLAWALRPWRKGPFDVFGTFIDSEWKSYIKYNLLESHFDLENKCVADIGCNNGYYLFRMLEQKPKKLVGFDPSIHYKTQFDFINHFVKSDIEFELLGIEHLPFYENKFDVIFCLGVLYHRSDPINSLKALYKGLNKGGELILDTFMIDRDGEFSLSPKDRYSKIPNIYFIPTIKALENWASRAKFKDFEILEIKTTNLDEQRKTDWIAGESLENFLDPTDKNLTIEGYPAPKRIYVKLRK